MIYEIRTYEIGPGNLAEVEKRFGEGYEARKKYSPLTAFWHTEIGPLNEIIHIWSYQDLAERARIRAEAAKDPNWPPKIEEFIRTMSSEIINPFDFVPTPQPGRMGPIFEIRYYTLKGGTLPAVAKGWSEKLPDRIKTWRDRGYRIHVMTGVSWGHYQDYLYGRFDGINHEDDESSKPWLAGFVVRELSRVASNWRSREPLISP